MHILNCLPFSNCQYTTNTCAACALHAEPVGMRRGVYTHFIQFTRIPSSFKFLGYIFASFIYDSTDMHLHGEHEVDVPFTGALSLLVLQCPEKQGVLV